MDVSIVIVNYNTSALLSECVRSIIKHTDGVEYEIIVVDNMSSDDSVAMLKRDFPMVNVIEAGENLGFGRANNVGMREASGRYILLLNSDTLLLNNAVGAFYMTAKSMKNAKIGAIGSILLGEDGFPCHSYGRFITPSFELRETLAKYFRFLKDKSNTDPEEVADYLNVDYVTGADMFVPRSVFEETGGFDPDYFMYCEEVDWQRRMADMGYERIVVDGPRIVHMEGGGNARRHRFWSASRLKNLYKSRKIYRKKHYNPMALPFLRGVLWVLDLPSILMTSVIKRDPAYLKLLKLK